MPKRRHRREWHPTPPEPARANEESDRCRHRAAAVRPACVARSRTALRSSYAARGGDVFGYWREGRQEPGNLLIEEVSRAGDAGGIDSRGCGNHNFFSTLAAQAHVSRRFLLGKCRVDPGLSCEKLLCGLQHLRRTRFRGGFLQNTLTLRH